MLWTWGEPPRLLLPEGLWKQLSNAQQDTLLAHELAHLRRRDHWVRWLELAAVAVYWWHPIVWWAQRELQESEEQCCDAWVVTMLPAAAEVYAEALLQTVVYLSQARAPVAVGASGAGRVHDVKRRLIMILDGTAPKALSPAGRWAVLLVAAVLLPLWPTWASSQVSAPSDSFRPQPVAVSASQPGSVPVLNDYRYALNANDSVALVFQAEEQGREEEINQARAAVRDLTSELALLRDRTESLSLRLQEARSRLARLEGRSEPPKRSELRTEPPALNNVQQGQPNLMLRTPATAPPANPGSPIRVPAATNLSYPPGVYANPYMQPSTSPPSMRPAASPSSDQPRDRRRAGQAAEGQRRGGEDYDLRLKELELKLDKLLAEFNTLRQRQPSKRSDAIPQSEHPH
jgi:hypothetical protein